MSFKNTDPLRNISVRKKDYLLQKFREGEQVYSEAFHTLAEAIAARDELEKADYEIDLI